MPASPMRHRGRSIRRGRQIISWLVLPLPIDTNEVAMLVEMHVELAMKGSLHRLADSPRKVDIGRADHDPVRHFSDAYDSVQRVLFFLDLFLMVGNRQDLGFMLLSHGACQGDDTRRVLIIDTVAGLAQLLPGVRGPRDPLPPILMEDRPALRADGGLMQLAAALIGIEDVIPLPTAKASSARLLDGARYGSLLHVTSSPFAC
jgi:hypothetical protein